ncbi:unnamed protein product [Orchesella dallaii]|uniref:phosphatidate phosphatase n=1 Tax=Orchesella dallaii TaxID=48710 RepID=A0ABP1S5H4_9HEXA
MSYFATIGRVIGNLKGFYSGINGATLTGSIDVIVIEQPDGTFKCSPFHVRFGKLGVLRSKEKVVDIEINGVPVPLRMKLGDSGEAFFVQEVESEDELVDEYLATSPLPGSPRLSTECSPCASKKGDSDDSEDATPEVENKNDVAITIVEEGPMNEIVTSKEVKSEDVKGRKRRKKRKKNQGSRSEIKLDMPQDVSETIFKMDEDLSHVAKAVQELDLEQRNNPVAAIPHNRSFHRDFFSDTEVEANSPHTSRPSTPIQSDSEYECSKVQKPLDEEVGKWVWGELPSTVVSTPVTTPTTTPAAKMGNGVKAPGQRDENPLSSDDEGSTGKDRSTEGKSMFSMFSFMKRQSQNPSGNASGGDSAPGIYLDDLNLESMDPETAALYFPSYIKELRDCPKPEHDDDGESGKGSSLPQSPAPGSSPKSSSMVNHMEEHRERQRQRQDSGTDVVFEAISLCGGNLNLFDQSLVTYDELVENPDILLNASPDSIVVKMNGKLVPWTAAMPQLLSTTFFKRPLPSQIFQKLVDQYMKNHESSSGHESSVSNISNGSGKDATKKGYSWFPWRRSQNPSNQEHPHPDENPSSSPESIKGKEGASVASSNEGSPSKARKDLTVALENATKSMPLSLTSSSDESEGTGGNEKTQSKVNRNPPVVNQISINSTTAANLEKFKKTLRLTTEQLNQLGLKYGQNEAVFSVTTAYQGTSVARCHIYLWKWDDRVVVSDIDGTITKSDVLGHILPIIGNDWAQSGVAQLFTQIQDNGYKMLYLSARAIGKYFADTAKHFYRFISANEC